MTLAAVKPAVLTAALSLLMAGSMGCGPAPEDSAESIVVVHGLGRTPASMAILASRLRSAGYRVVSFAYPSTSEPMEALLDSLESELARCCGDETQTVHFVTHSMGGVVVRSYLAQQPEAHRGRVVMLSPPNQGSEVIDAFADSPLLRLVAGPAGSMLGTDSTGIPRRLGPVRFSLGIIAGDRSLNPLYSWLIPGPDDGKVGVDRTRVEGAADFLVVPATHTFIMNRKDVADQVVYFLRAGHFRSTANDAASGAAESCQLFMDALTAVPHVELSMRVGELESIWDQESFSGCEIEFETNDSITAGAAVPDFDALKGTEMHQRGWLPTEGVGADGPGSGLFGIERGPVACVIRWAQPASIDDDGEFVQSETLTMMIQCEERAVP